VKRADPGTQVDQSRPISRSSDLQIQSNHDAVPFPPLPARADRLVKSADPGAQVDQSRPISRSSDLQTQSNHDAVPFPPLPARADRLVKRSDPGAQVDQSRPISRISDLQIQSNHDSVPSPQFSERVDRLVKRSDPGAQVDQSRPINRSSDLQTQSNNDAMISLPLPARADMPGERVMMGKQGYLEVSAFPANRDSHRNALRSSDEDDGLMQSMLSAQNALSPKSTQSTPRTYRSKEPDMTVQPIFTEQKETWFMDRRMNAFSEKSPSVSNSSIKVNIGRVEVRAAAPTPPPTKQAASTSRSGLSLDDYLKRRR